ncbi:MAG: hypothetical protein FJZ00_08455 [Candidatus Sericytochromatia bacterium]|uniref:Uncharacterized protein n=1 Tax=Candidatus Tanganyikabacteria bacterium TaxID=2961651 RepID=A0A937X6F3_9BACT|nr:hypothetical protein [Candidatus Tanganyikabacteria bacterium]
MPLRDSLVVGAAKLTGYRVLLAEDLQDKVAPGYRLVGNPFRRTPDGLS